MTLLEQLVKNLETQGFTVNQILNAATNALATTALQVASNAESDRDKYK